MHLASELFPNPAVGAAVTEYSIEHSTSLGETINKHRNDTIAFAEREGLFPGMMINTAEAQFIVFVAKLNRVKRVLEIGCFTGYSALALAEAVKSYPDGEVVTLDIDYKATTYAEETFRRTGADKIIKLIKGPAQETLPSLTGQFDLIFLDANKDGYVGYLEKIIEQKLLAPNGVILADNTLYAGLVANKKDNPAANRRQVGSSEHLDRFNKFVRDHQELENVLLPAFDGLNMIRFKNPERQ